VGIVPDHSVNLLVKTRTDSGTVLVYGGKSSHTTYRCKTVKEVLPPGQSVRDSPERQGRDGGKSQRSGYNNRRPRLVVDTKAGRLPSRVPVLQPGPSSSQDDAERHDIFAGKNWVGDNTIDQPGDGGRDGGSLGGMSLRYKNVQQPETRKTDKQDKAASPTRVTPVIQSGTSQIPGQAAPQLSTFVRVFLIMQKCISLTTDIESKSLELRQHHDMQSAYDGLKQACITNKVIDGHLAALGAAVSASDHKLAMVAHRMILQALTDLRRWTSISIAMAGKHKGEVWAEDVGHLADFYMGLECAINGDFSRAEDLLGSVAKQHKEKGIEVAQAKRIVKEGIRSYIERRMRFGLEGDEHVA
jgi:hypothetical protein